MSIAVERLPLNLTPDPRRVILRFFGGANVNRARDVINRVLGFPEADVERLVAGLAADFEAKHPRLFDVFAEHCERVRGLIPEDRELSSARRSFLGSCFTMEYALESVALFNPSMVPAKYQDDVPPGSLRFVMSLRATGEGHVSSIIFRAGVVDAEGNIELEPPADSLRPLQADFADAFDKPEFERDLTVLGVAVEEARVILDRLGARFTRKNCLTPSTRRVARKRLRGRSSRSPTASSSPRR